MGVFDKDYIIGLDIGTASVKMVQFRKFEGGGRLIKSDIKEIKHTDNDALREKEIVSALKDLIKGSDAGKCRIIANINCPMTAIKKEEVPYMPKKELGEGIKLEAKNYFPFPLEGSSLDFEVLKDTVENGARKYEIEIATSPKATVDKHLSLLAKAGIRPASFIPSSYALQKLAEDQYAGEGAVLCFLDIGRRYTELLIMRGKEPMLSRKIPVAGDDFTKALTGALVSDIGKTQLTPEEAEKIKREIGIPPEGESGIIDNKISSSQILSMLRAPLENMISEIDRCLNYYKEREGGGIDRIVLFGGSASLKGLTGFVSEALGIEVRLGNVLEGLGPDEKSAGGENGVSHRMDLAVGAVFSGAKGVNLLPREIKEEKKNVLKRGVVEALAAAVILTLAFTFAGMRIQLNNFKKRIAAARMELNGLEPHLKKAEARYLAGRALADEPHWEDVFKELSNVIPDSVYLTVFSVHNGVITVKGIAESRSSEQVISNFIFTLENGIFNDVELVKSRDLREGSGSEFQLRFRAD